MGAVEMRIEVLRYWEFFVLAVDNHFRDNCVRGRETIDVIDFVDG